MNATKPLIAVGLAVALMWGSSLHAGSIWAKGHRRARAIYSDDTARDVGDILTIVIKEATKIENATNRKLDKNSTRSASTSGSFDPANIIGAVGEHVFDFPQLTVDATASTKFDGGADFDADRSMTDKVSVVVEDVLPNGNLVVLGTRTRNVAGDTLIIQVSGLVRPSDVSISNEVDSERVADFHIVYKTKGQENGFSNPGWLDRAVNFLNPF